MANDYVARYIERIRGLRTREPPLPWKRFSVQAVGGLTEVGFGENTELLLVVSHNGRGVFDCRNGQKIARDYDPPDRLWYQPIQLRATGIGPLAGVKIRLAGLHGGGLPICTEDGWSLELVSPDWPDSGLILQPPGTSIYMDDRSGSCVKVADVDVLRVYGFSDTGRTFIIASSHTLEIFGRGAA
jgi:hypothetical protein